MQSKLMLILWHWDQLQIRPEEGYDLIPVKNSGRELDQEEKKIIIRLDEGRRKPSVVIKKMQTIVQNYQTKAQDNEWLIFLHKESFDSRFLPDLQKVIMEIKPLSKRIQFIPFGGGDHFIYYKKATDTGLINQFGDLMHAKCKNDLDKDDSWDLRTVLAPNTNLEDPAVEAKYFNKVWDYYHFRSKKELFELHENLIFFFAAQNQWESTAKNGSLSAFLAQNAPELNRKLSSICQGDDLNQQQIKELYGSDEIVNRYTEWCQYINQHPFNPKQKEHYLFDLREKFRALLSAMPEAIY